MTERRKARVLGKTQGLKQSISNKNLMFFRKKKQDTCPMSDELGIRNVQGEREVGV
jgi:hypothetical protein